MLARDRPAGILEGPLKLGGASASAAKPLPCQLTGLACLGAPDNRSWPLHFITADLKRRPISARACRAARQGLPAWRCPPAWTGRARAGSRLLECSLEQRQIRFWKVRRYLGFASMLKPRKKVGCLCTEDLPVTGRSNWRGAAKLSTPFAVGGWLNCLHLQCSFRMSSGGA